MTTNNASKTVAAVKTPVLRKVRLSYGSTVIDVTEGNYRKDTTATGGRVGVAHLTVEISEKGMVTLRYTNRRMESTTINAKTFIAHWNTGINSHFGTGVTVSGGTGSVELITA